MVRAVATQSDGNGSNPTRDILQWLRGRIVSPSLVGILLHPQIEPVTKVTFILLIKFYFIFFFAVNNEVETRREESGYEVSQKSRLVLLFDDFGPVL